MMKHYLGIVDTITDKGELIDVYSKTEDDALLLLKANVADIVDSYSKSEDDALLLLKADKTELIDSYSKSEDDALLLLKADKTELIDSYSKSEDDAQQLLKADKTELVESYSKTEDDALLLLKANVADIVDSYSKSEDDALLLLKADKTELIDSYSKSEDDALLLLKADKTELIESYSKTEEDALLLLIANVAEIVDSYSKTEDDALLLLKANVADIVDSCSKSEDDALLLLKADKSELIDSYSKSEDDALLLLKADKTELIDSYSKSEDDALLLLKADKTELIDTYSKIEDGALLLLKANVADLTNYVDLTSTQTIIVQKQFGVICVSTISKLSKNDASILLAGGGDMLVSSLVTQPQLQEVRDIATRKSKAYVFSTQGELNDWMAVQDNVAKLVIGDNLYIVDKEVTDYWCDGTDLKVLKTELLDMNNVVTTLGVTTGGGNAITDISIDGNTLTPAKNKNFVDTDYDQSFSGQKTFNTTIHSVGIMVQTYDNSNVVCAGGGVRSIADIQSASYSKSEDDALLLLKADKTQLIDSYSKSETYARDEVYTKVETNNLLNNKADSGVSNTKGEDDTLLLLKSDKTQLIDSQTKTETNNLFKNKADNGVSYSKGEDDALLLLKTDKTQLIDAYTKDEINNLLNSKVDTGVSYSKNEDDTLLFAKADKTQLIDSFSKSETYARVEVYTKGETDNLLISKANTGVSYTKGEDDTLLFAKEDKTQLIDSYTKGDADNLLNNKANQTTTYTKIEINQHISQIEVGEVDLSGCMTLGTSQTINANKTFNNACRFVSAIDGMLTVIGSSFVKQGADDTVVSLGAGGIKPISELTTTFNDSNYVKKDGNVQGIQGIIRKTTLDQPFPEPTDDDYITLGAVKSEFVSSIYSGSINGNLTATQFIKSGGIYQQELLANGTTKPLSELTSGSVDDTNYVKKSGKEIQVIHGVLRRDDDELSVSEFDEDYLTRGEIYNAFVSRYDNQTIYGTKTFNANVRATGFVKTGKDDTSVLLAGGDDRLLSSFGGIENLTSPAFSNMNGAVIQYKLIRIGSLYIFSLLANGGNYIIGTFNTDYLVQDDVAIITYIPFPNHTVDKGGYVSITDSTGLITYKSTTNTYIQWASATWVK
ncbi:MAG: hypothetical protein EZS28_001709 [Streblomastix strix]|uniref:Uncharacterized protein n=1 Tax=Streblomastix strix TaxID=222440 RepID=A0A5J4X6G0_9EUKA|nr:MAG: hypothetical protein EZS28_001709 [Streblomastix strix]